MKFTLLIATMAFFLSTPAHADNFDKTMMPKLQGAQEQVQEIMQEKAEKVMAPAAAVQNIQTGKIKAVAFHSDNCGSCKILGPRMQQAMSIINSKRVQVVKFDFTNKQSTAETQELAAEKNVSHVLEKHGAKSGFVIILNDQGEEVDIVKVDHDTGDIASKLAVAIADAS